MAGSFNIAQIKKVIATILVAVIFLYFWINGPIMHSIEILSLETEESEYSNPVMVGSDGVDNKNNRSTYQLLQFEKEEEFGHGLILDREEEPVYWGMVADEKHNPGLSKELKDRILVHAKKFSDEEDSVQIKPSMDMYFATITSEDSEEQSIYLESTHIVKNVRGYAGEIQVGIILGSDGFIQRVEHISSKETESYLADIKKAGFYEQFNDVSLTGGDQHIDAVSGATLSSEAIATTVSELIGQAVPDPISNYAEIDEVNFFSLSAALNNAWILHLAVIFLMFVFGIQKWIKKSKKSVLALSILSTVYIGFFLNSSFTYISFLHPFLGTSVSSFIGLYSLFVLLGAIWGKNAYCKYVCPFGNVQRIIIKANPWKTQRKFFISNKWVKRIRMALTVILITGILLGLRSWSNYELFPDLFGLSMLSVWFLVAVITVFVTMIYPMLWCRLLCPTGSLLDGITDLMNYKRKFNQT